MGVCVCVLLLENVQESKAVLIRDIPEYHQVMQILQSDECRRQVREYLYKAVRHYGPSEVDIVIQGDLKVVSFQFDLSSCYFV